MPHMSGAENKGVLFAGRDSVAGVNGHTDTINIDNERIQVHGVIFIFTVGCL